MKRSAYLLCFWFLLFSAEIISQTVCSYSYRRRITFHASQVGGTSDLVNFPALVHIVSDNDLRTTGNGGHVQNTNGYDIIFTRADGVTLLDFELERFTATTGQLSVWVKLPLLSVSADTYIYMYYGNSAIVSNQSSTAVWTGYDGVWHFQGGSFGDSSPTTYNCTNNGSSNQAVAQINNGRSLDGNDWLEVANTFPNKNSDFTISGWAYTTNNTRAGQRIFCDDVNNTGGFALSIGDGGTGVLRFYSRGSTNVILDSPGNTVSNNTWYYFVGVADVSNSVRRIYVNGVQVGSVASVGWGTDNGNASIGGETASGETSNRLLGRIDEVRVASSALSAGWILTEYNNQSSPSTFHTIAAEPDMWDGSASTAWTTNGNWVAGVDPVAGDDVILDNVGNSPNLNTSIQLRSLYVRPGVTLSMANSQTLSISTDILNCGTINGNGTSALVMNSNNSFVQNQDVSGSGTYNIRNFIVNNTFATSPSVTLGGDLAANVSLQLTSGVLVTSATNMLSLGTGATSTSGSAATYVSGPMEKSGTTAFVFPVGKNGAWRRLGISAPTSSSTFRAEYFSSAYSNTSSVNSPLFNVSALEYWQLDRVAGTGNASVTLHWEDASASVINDCPDLTIARWNGTGWDEHAATTDPGSACSGSGVGSITTNAVVTAFSPFTFASKTNAVNALPVELVSFEATCVDGKTMLRWVTATEWNNDRFIVEWSADAFIWEESAVVKAAGESRIPVRYELLVNLPAVAGYVRLVQIDRDGNRQFYDPLFVHCKNSAGDDWLRIYPNPAGRFFTVELLPAGGYGPASLKISDNLGRECRQFTLDGTGTYELPLDLNAGSYLVEVQWGGRSLPPKKLIVR